MFKGAALGAMLGASIGPASIPAKDPRLEKFSKMLRMHMPEGAVMLKMQAEGFDPALLGLEHSTSCASPKAPASLQRQDTGQTLANLISLPSGNVYMPRWGSADLACA